MGYASHIECYRADSNGMIYRSGLRIYVGNVLKYQTIGLEMLSDDVWAVIFGPVILGQMDARNADKDGYISLKVLPM